VIIGEGGVDPTFSDVPGITNHARKSDVSPPRNLAFKGQENWLHRIDLEGRGAHFKLRYLCDVRLCVLRVLCVSTLICRDLVDPIQQPPDGRLVGERVHHRHPEPPSPPDIGLAEQEVSTVHDGLSDPGLE